jgi:hypothetical protein
MLNLAESITVQSPPIAIRRKLESLNTKFDSRIRLGGQVSRITDGKTNHILCMLGGDDILQMILDENISL